MTSDARFALGLCLLWGAAVAAFVLAGGGS